MPELDHLLSKSIALTIKENLGEKTAQKIENRLFEKYGTNLTQSLQDFTRLDSVLREFFGMGADGLERQFLGKTITLERTMKEPSWVTLESKSLSKSILGALADSDKKSILDSVSNESRVISDILEICKISNTLGHDKINSLIDEGLLVPEGQLMTHSTETKYRSIFENIKMDIDKHKVILKVKIPTSFLEKSSIMPVIQVH